MSTNLVVAPMVWNRERLFEMTWRVALLLLPWQTRWLHAGLALGGYPWEWGNVAVYVSWLPMLATVFLSDRFYRSHRPYRTYLLVAALAATSLAISAFRPASLQWWAEVGILFAFAFTLARRVDRSLLARWTIYAIVPHAVLALSQHLIQFVIGSKWLGIAPQNPLTPGVSVVEVLGKRWLRAYGGLPHPNILGGWLVLGIGLLLARDRVEADIMTKAATYIRCSLLVLFSTALALTFSRSAWLALFTLFYFSLWRVREKGMGRRCKMWIFLVFLPIGLTLAARWPLVATRSGGETVLEQRSLNERALGKQYAWELFQRHPWLGVGPRATGFALLNEGIAPTTTSPILPHTVPLLILTEFGLFGVFLSLLVLARFVKLLGTPFFFLSAFIPVALLDHYLVSTWSGLALTALIFLFSYADEDS